MGARGRKSAASLEVVHAVQAIVRPAPIDELTPEQADVWIEVVNRMPADWFTQETHGLLAQYCRHVVSARRVSVLIERHIEDTDTFGWLKEYDRLLRMQEREGRALSLLATRMRLTQHSRYDRDKKIGNRPKQPLHLS